MKFIKCTLLFSSILLLFTLYFSKSCFAGTYWVHPLGTSGWSTCKSTTDPGSNYCSIATANNSVTAGDTVYIKGGTYTSSSNFGIWISPQNSGSSGNMITYSAAPGETPIFTQSSYATITMYGISLGWGNTASYIKVTGLTFKNLKFWLQIVNGSHHNEISYCSFTSDNGYEAGTGVIIRGANGAWCTHNWIHHNIFSKRQATDPCAESVDVMTIGSAYTANLDNNNTIEDNYFEYAGHTLLDNFATYTVIRNNIMHNEPWIDGCTTSSFDPVYVNSAYNGLYGHRNLHLSPHSVPQKKGTYVLVEGNRLGHASTNPGNAGPMNLDLAAPRNIVRYNDLYNGMQSGIYFKYANDTGGAAPGGIDNRVYNNTIYHHGYGYDWDTYYQPGYNLGHGIQQFNTNPAIPTLNVIKNNIVYDSSNGDICDTIWTGANCTPNTKWDTITNNWLTSDGDPKFQDTTLTDTSSLTLPILTLQSNSPAINKGSYLTLATNAGVNATSLTVADALYFQDGTWGSDLTRAADTMHADWIAIDTVDNVAQITSINYETKTITLASPITWTFGSPIWLYKESHGSRVLHGSAPDIGAHEYSADTGTEISNQAPDISFSPTSLSFSGVLSGQLSSPQTINVGNTGAEFVTISAISLSGTDANQFSIPAATDYCTGETVAASGNCSFQIIFSPTSQGEKAANVNLTALYYSTPATLPLYGSAVVYKPVPRVKISKIK